MLVMCFMMVFVVIMLRMIYFHIVFLGGPGRTNNSSTWLRNKGLGYLDGLNEPDVT